MKKMALLFLVLGAALCIPIVTYAQENNSDADLLEKLKPMKAGSPAKLKVMDIDAMEKATLNRIAVEERNNATATAKDVTPIAPQLLELPTAELAINFGRNSSQVEPRSIILIAKLASVLADPDLRSSKFLVAGHTDAKGTSSFNLELSKKRASVVRALLVNDFSVPPDRVVSIGFGEEQLKNSADPEAAENRRVEIINVGAN